MFQKERVRGYLVLPSNALVRNEWKGELSLPRLVAKTNPSSSQKRLIPSNSKSNQKAAVQNPR